MSVKVLQLAIVLVLCSTTVGAGKRAKEDLDEVWNDVALQTAQQLSGGQTCSNWRNFLESTLVEHELKSLRIESVKETILTHLGLSQPPSVSGEPVTLPRLIARGSHSTTVQQPTRPLSNDRVILLFSGINCTKPNGKFQMNSVLEISMTVLPEDIHSVHMWFYTGQGNLDSCVLQSRQCSQEEAIERIIPFQQVSHKDGWTQFDITWPFTGWIELNEHCQNFTLTCAEDLTWPESTGTQDGSLNPFVLADLIPPNHLLESAREKRKVNCVKGSTECCRESLDISFNDIGWGDWIIQPTHYNAYYCRGSCSNPASISLSTAPYYTVMRKFLHSILADGQHSELIPCCTPARLSPLQIIYKTPNNTIREKIIEDLIVESCGCM